MADKMKDCKGKDIRKGDYVYFNEEICLVISEPRNMYDGEKLCPYINVRHKRRTVSGLFSEDVERLPRQRKKLEQFLLLKKLEGEF